MGADPTEGQPCAGCGRMTGVGTPLFSDRQTTRGADGAAIYLCGDCNERAVSQFRRRSIQHDMPALAARAAGLGMGTPGGIGAGGGPG